MPDSSTLFDVVNILGFLVIFVAYALTAYWGLAFRRRMLVRDYRNQALGVVLLAAYFYVIAIPTAVIPVSDGSPLPLVLANAFVDYVGFFAILLYWVNSTVSVARRADPLERDPLRYSVVRYLWVGAIVASFLLAILISPISLVYTVAVAMPPIPVVLSVLPVIIFAAYGGILLFVLASRSRDRTVQTHLKWFAVYVIALFVNIAIVGTFWRVTGGDSAPFRFLDVPLFVASQIIAAYFLYRSVKSLVPTTKTL